MTPRTQILEDPLFDGYNLRDFLPIIQHLVPSDSDDHGYESDTDLESESEVAPLSTYDSIGTDRFECPLGLSTGLRIHRDDDLDCLPVGDEATATASSSHETGLFCDLPVYIKHTSNPDDIQSLERFDEKIFNLVNFLVNASKETTMDKIISHSSWVKMPFKQPLSHSKTVVICQIFQRAFPESSRVILGQVEITSDHLLSLPLVEDSCKNTVGVYINCAVGTPSEHQKHQVSDLSTGSAECQIMTPIAKDLDYIAIYAGSSTADLEGRVRHQERAIETIRTGKRPYHHQVVQENGLTSNFRMLAIVQPSLPDLGLDCASSGWLIRLLEMVIIMLLDACLPPDPDSFRIRFGMKREEYFGALDSCGIPRSKF